MVGLRSSAVCIAFAPQWILGDGILTCIAGSSRDADPGHDGAATATGSLENSSRVVGLISSKDKDGRAIRTEVEHVPLRRQGIESFFCGRAEEASLKPWNTPGEQTKTPGRSTAKGFTVAKLREGGASWERDCNYCDRRLEAILIHLYTSHPLMHPCNPVFRIRYCI